MFEIRHAQINELTSHKLTCYSLAIVQNLLTYELTEKFMKILCKSWTIQGTISRHTVA